MTEKQQQRRATTDSTSSNFSIVVEIPSAVPVTSSTSTASTSSTKDVLLPKVGQQSPMKAAITSAQQAVGGEENRPTFDELQSIERHRREILLRVSCIVICFSSHVCDYFSSL